MDPLQVLQGYCVLESPLWSQIAAGLREPTTAAPVDNLIKKQTSAPGPPPINSLSQQLQLNMRAVSHDPNLIRAQSTEAASRQSSLSDSISSTVPKSIARPIFITGDPEDVERSGSATPQALVPKRRGGRVRYLRRDYSRGQSASDSYSNASDASSASSTLLNTPVHRSLDGFEGPENGTADEDTGGARAKPGPDSSSVMSVQVHGGYQKWKWKH